MPQFRPAARPLAYAAAVIASSWGMISAVSWADAQPAGAFVALTGSNDQLDSLRWKARPVVVLADRSDDPAYRVQMATLKAAGAELAARDIVVLSESDGMARGLRADLGEPSGFRVLLIGKDGGIKIDRTSPLGVEELFATIDTMPMRQREMDG